MARGISTAPVSLSAISFSHPILISFVHSCKVHIIIIIIIIIEVIKKEKMNRSINVVTIITSVQAGAVLMPLAMICFRSKV